MLLNCGVEEDSESPLDYKEIQPVHPKGNQSWIFIGKSDAEAETPILGPPSVKNWLTGKYPDAGKLKAGGEGDDRGWDGGMASLTQWTWVWVSSRSWWLTGKPGLLQSMGSQRVRHDWATELNWWLVMLNTFDLANSVFFGKMSSLILCVLNEIIDFLAVELYDFI